MLVAWRCVGHRVHDDSYGGVEAEAVLELALERGASAHVELSRTRNLRNSAIVRGRLGTIEVSLHKHEISAAPREVLTFQHEGHRGDRLPTQRLRDLFRRQGEDWLRAIRTGTRPTVAGTDAARSITLIESCYGQCQPLDLPWVTPHGAAPLRV